MKKILFALLLLVTLSGNAYSAINELWTTSAEAIWTDLWDDDPEHEFKTFVMANLTATDYDYTGLVPAIAYQMTGNTTYAENAFTVFNSGNCRYIGATWNVNLIRNLYAECSIAFSLFANGISGANKASAMEDLEEGWDLASNSVNGSFAYAKGIGDSDQMVGTYFGAMLHAAAIEDDDPTLYSDIMTEFGIDTGVTPRDTIQGMFNTYFDGAWVEGSWYSLYTAYKYALLGTVLLNEYYGEDKFPEITAEYANIANFMINQMTPGFADKFHFGDEEQAGWGLGVQRVQQAMATAAYVADNAIARYIFDALWSDSISRQQVWVLLGDNKSTLTAPSGQTSYHADKMGITLFHDGWNSTDAMASITHRTYATYDHNSEASPHFELYDNQGWVIRTPYGYNETEGIPQQYTNGLLVNGAFPSKYSEARDNTYDRQGSDYAYSVFTAGGQQVYGWSFYHPPAEHLKEFTNSVLYRANGDGSHTFIHFDRLKAFDPQTHTEDGYWGFVRYSEVDSMAPLGAKVESYSSKNIWRMWTAANPTLTGSCAGGRVTWTQNSQTVYWDNKLSSCAYVEELGTTYEEDSYTNLTPFDAYYRADLQVTSTDSFQTMLNFIHTGSNPTTSKVTSTAGEASVGAYYEAGSDNVLAIFSAIEPTYPSATAIDGEEKYKRDSDKINKIKDLKNSSTGTTITFTTSGNTTLFVADLDAAESWQYAVDGGSAVGLTPVDGLATTDLTLDSGEHTIVISTGEAAPSPDPTTIVIGGGCSFSGAGGF